MRTDTLIVRVGYLNQPTLDQRVIRSIDAPRGAVPVFNALTKGRDLVGNAVPLEVEQGGRGPKELRAQFEVPPYVAADLLAYRRFAHLELIGGDVHREHDGTIYLGGGRLGCFYISEQPWAWASPWGANVVAVTA